MPGTSRAGILLTLCASGAVLTIGPSRASADPIPLSVVAGPTIQQTENRPCIIGDPSCHNPVDLPYSVIAPQFSEGTLTSPIYTVGQIRSAVGGDTFLVGLDLNQARGHNGGTYTLESFVLSIDGVPRYSTQAASTLTPINRGNGFSDATIGVFDLSGLSSTQHLVFNVAFTGGTAGREQFFLSTIDDRPTTPAPEPGTMLLFGSGLAAMLAARRRRARAAQ